MVALPPQGLTGPTRLPACTFDPQAAFGALLFPKHTGPGATRTARGCAGRVPRFPGTRAAGAPAPGRGPCQLQACVPSAPAPILLGCFSCDMTHPGMPTCHCQVCTWYQPDQ